MVQAAGHDYGACACVQDRLPAACHRVDQARLDAHDRHGRRRHASFGTQLAQEAGRAACPLDVPAQEVELVDFCMMCHIGAYFSAGSSGLAGIC